jgi:hypothetical protein
VPIFVEVLAGKTHGAGTFAGGEVRVFAAGYLIEFAVMHSMSASFAVGVFPSKPASHW